MLAIPGKWLRFKILGPIMVTGLVVYPEVAFGETTPKSSDSLAAPETEIGLITSEIEAIVQSAESISKLGAATSASTAKNMASNALDRGKKFFAAGDWLLAIRELKTAAESSQVMLPGDSFLMNQMLGACYENIGITSAAFRHYRRALIEASSADTTTSQKALETMIRYSELLGLFPSQQDEIIETALSSFAAMKFGPEIDPIVLFQAAKIAYRFRNYPQADHWYSYIIKSNSNPNLIAKATFGRALVALRNEQYDDAKSLLEKALTASNKGSEGLRGSINLALGRIETRRQNLDSAEAYYEEASKSESEREDALYELIQIRISSSKYTKAYDSAHQFLREFAQSPKRLNARTTLAFLALEKGDLAEANEQISSSILKLNELSRDFHQTFKSGDDISPGAIHDLIESADGIISVPVFIRDLDEQFSRIQSLSERMSGVGGDINQLGVALGSHFPDELFPFAERQSEQLGELANRAMAAGNRLVNLETALYSNKLNDIERFRLASSHKSRVELAAKLKQNQIAATGWTNWANVARLSTGLSKRSKLIDEQRADLAAIKFLAKQSSTPSDYNRVANLETRLNSAKRAITQSVRVTMLAKFQSLANASRSYKTNVMSKRVASLMNAESILLASHRDKESAGPGMLLATDLATSWRRWEFAMATIINDLTLLHSRIRLSLESTSNEVELHNEHLTEIRSKAEQLRSDLTDRTRSSFTHFSSSFDNAVSQKLQKLQKWRADMLWLDRESTASSAESETMKFNLQTEIMRDEIQRIESGVTSP